MVTVVGNYLLIIEFPKMPLLLSILKDQGFIDFFTTSLPAEEKVSKHTGRIYLKYSGHPWKSYKDPAL